MDWRTFEDLGGQGRSQVQRPMRQIQVVTAKVSQRAAAEGPPIPPIEGDVLGAVGPLLDRAQPQVVVQPGGHGRRLFGPLLAAIGDINPHVRLLHGPNDPAPDQLDYPPVVAPA